MPCLLVFAPLRWSLLRDRTQHLMSRLARRWPVFVVEPPIREAPDAAGIEEMETPDSGVRLLRPRPPSLSGWGTWLAARMARATGADDGCIAWLTSPWAVTVLPGLRPRAVVADWLDPQAVDGLPMASLPQRALLAAADLVFAPGPTTYEALRRLHPHVHCLCNAVEAPRFAPGPHTRAATAAPVRLGFHGLIDAGIDLDLVAHLADARPRWHFVMAGPLHGLKRRALPGRPNLHWAGPQPEGSLSALISGWDACLLPYREDAATRHLCPAVALQYLAAEKPVIGTALQDVAMLYGHVVRIASGPQAFLQACDAALSEDARARSERASDMFTTASRFSWDASAEAVRGFLEPLAARPAAVAVRTPARPAAPVMPRRQPGRARLRAVPSAVPVPASGGTNRP